MDNEGIKELLLKIEETALDFTVTMTGKKSSKVNGFYKPETHEIFLHNRNFKTDNMLVYTAIHEYTHHLVTEKKLRETGGLDCSDSRCHTSAFWAKFHSLLEEAEKKNLYILDLKATPELEALTENIRSDYITKNGQLMIDFGQKLREAHKLCEESGIRFEDYIDRILRLPRTAVLSISRLAGSDLDPSVGFENLKTLSSIRNKKDRADAQQLLLFGKSPDEVKQSVKKPEEEIDVRTRLEKEKSRLEKTIAQLSQRLELVEEKLGSL